jgi:hypothetical protein
MVSSVWRRTPRSLSRRRWLRWSAIAPHLFVPALAREVIGLPNKRLSQTSLLDRLFGENAGHRARFDQLLFQRLAVATGQWRVVKFR